MIIPPIAVSFTRPANVTGYAAGDVIANSASAPTVPSITIPQWTPGADRLPYLVEAMIRTNNVLFIPRLRLHLFDTVPTGINDNAAFVTWADRAKRIGFLDIPALSAPGASNDATVTVWRDIPKPLPLPLGKFWFITEIVDAGTPASEQIFDFAFTFDNGR